MAVTDKRPAERSFPIEKALCSRNILADRDIFAATPKESGGTAPVHEATTRVSRSVKFKAAGAAVDSPSSPHTQ